MGIVSLNFNANNDTAKATSTTECL